MNDVKAFPEVFATEVSRIAESIKERPATEQRPLKLWVMDESRFGLKTIRRRRITLSGVKPVALINDEYDNCYLFGAFAPLDGSSVIWEMPFFNALTFGEYIKAFAEDDQAKNYHNIMLIDNAPVHHATSITLPSNVSFVFLPAYSPELNPAERVWEYFKGKCGGKVFCSLDELSAWFIEEIQDLKNTTVSSLTSYDWIMNAINAQLST